MLTEQKIKHNVTVARLCYKIAKEKYKTNENFARAMWTIGYNHDIGYEFIEDSSNISAHSDISDELIFSAFKGDSYAIKWHGKKISQSNVSLRILNEADLQVDSKGNIISVKERLEDIRLRYGNESKQYDQAKWLAIELGLIGELDEI